MKNLVRGRDVSAEKDGAEIVDTYTKLSTTYEQTRLTPYMQLVEEIERDVVAEQVRKLGACAALEIGCGTGRFSEFLARSGCRVYALDITPAMLKQAKTLRGDLSAITWIGASADKLPLPDDSCDLVLSLKVLPHVPDLASALDDIVRVLRPAGTAILEFYNPLSLGSLTRRYKVFTHWLSPARVEQLLERAGLTTTGRRGVRTVIPFGGAMNIPLLAPVLGWMERILSKSSLCRLASYYIVIAKHSSHTNTSR